MPFVGRQITDIPLFRTKKAGKNEFLENNLSWGSSGRWGEQSELGEQWALGGAVGVGGACVH
jgi:hypothetical protein